MQTARHEKSSAANGMDDPFKAARKNLYPPLRNRKLGEAADALASGLIADPEIEVRRLLAYLDLPFEEGCLRFHENKRAVNTLSSAQVRVPLYKTGMAQWQPYERWLGPLKAALGDVLEG